MLARRIVLVVMLLSLPLWLVACGEEGGDTGADAAPMCMGTLELYSTCTESTECDSCLCYTYNQGAMICSKACELDTDCPAPSTGCNNMGVCKRPQ